jgi:hypothetical protein
LFDHTTRGGIWGVGYRHTVAHAEADIQTIQANANAGNMFEAWQTSGDHLSRQRLGAGQQNVNVAEQRGGFGGCVFAPMRRQAKGKATTLQHVKRIAG